MTTLADLVMPKLGLTMTEGTVAEWAAAPGASFDADDLLVVVETDKISYEITAPSAGTLANILVPSGTTVAVGTPIAQWEPKGASVHAGEAAPLVTEQHATGNAAAVPGPLPSRNSPPTAPTLDARIVATPYARRIAREAGIELANVAATNNRRIRAADVETAIARRAAAAVPAALPARHHPLEPPLVPASSQAGHPAAAFAFLGTQVNADRMLRLIADIAEVNPELAPAHVHFVVLAAARALVDRGIAPVIGLQHDHLARHIYGPDTYRRLSTIVAADRANSSPPSATVTLLISDCNDATVVANTPSPGCAATLGVGAINRVFRPDATRTAVLRAEFDLVLCLRDDVALPDDRGLLARIRALLENPLILLAI